MTALPMLRFGALFALVGITAGCSGESTFSSATSRPSMTSMPSRTAVDVRETTSTTTPPPTEPRLLDAADLGAGFEDRPYRSDDQGRGPCLLALPDTPVPIERLGASFTSNAALEQATVQLVVHADDTAASVAYAAARRDSACTGEENREDGAPRPSHVVGADEAFSIGYVNQNDGAAVTVARAAETLVVASVTFHFGVTTSDGVVSDDLATRALDHLG